jgi:GNAT superfamily N-acetyltransferase
MKKQISEILRIRLIEHQLKDIAELIDEETFIELLEGLNTLNLEDDQVGVPNYNEETDDFLGYIKYGYLHVRNRDELPDAGPFELFVLDNNDEVMGFIRGTKNTTYISFNLIYIHDEHRGLGTGLSIYEYFLNEGLAIKSDSEITDSTYGLYMKLLSMGYKPLMYTDGTVGLVKQYIGI